MIFLGMVIWFLDVSLASIVLFPYFFLYRKYYTIRIRVVKSGIRRRRASAHLTLQEESSSTIIEPAPEGGYWAICPEVPGANGQGEPIEETKNSLREAIQLILEERKADILRGLPEDAIQENE